LLQLFANNVVDTGCKFSVVPVAKFAAVFVDTGGKFATCVFDTNGKFVTSVIDIGCAP
jgi:hypothetical protein